MTPDDLNTRDEPNSDHERTEHMNARTKYRAVAAYADKIEPDDVALWSECADALDEIDRLRAENEQLRAQLGDLITACHRS